MYQKFLQSTLSKALETFTLPLNPLVARQKRVLDQLIQRPFTNLGISVAVGKNFASSAHRDEDSGYTFSGTFTTAFKDNNLMDLTLLILG